MLSPSTAANAVLLETLTQQQERLKERMVQNTKEPYTPMILFTKDNGFENIVVLPPGTSPNGYINMIDEQREADMLAGRESDPTLPGIKT